MATVFEKIIAGTFEGSFVHRDDLCVAFMDIHPFNKGHVLVVPRAVVERLSDLDPSLASHLFAIGQKVLRAIENSALQCEGANLFISDGEIAGQEVPHVHLHIVPRFQGDGISISFGKAVVQCDREELDKVAALISTSMSY